ncbi:MAG: hypothetical protein AB7T49_15900 [Oligoflexales bacterium]
MEKVRHALCILALSMASTPGFSEQKTTTTDATTKTTMRSLYVAISELLPLSLNGKEFSSEKNRQRILRDLEQLSKSSNFLVDHFRATGRSSYNYLASSLRRDSFEAYRLYQSYQYNDARFTLHHITENCVSCHTKLENSSTNFNIPAFFAKINESGLDSLEVAHYYVMARKFDKALDVYERELTNGDTNYMPPRIFADYSKIVLRVNQNPLRAKKTLEKILPSIQIQSQKDLTATWLTSLDNVIAKKMLDRSDLKTAKELMTLAQNSQQYPADPRGLMYFVCASSILNKYVADDKHSPEELSEAYYLLGKSEYFISDSFWVSEMDYFLESAIRLAPQTASAVRAYNMLEQQYIIGYSGSSGVHLPADIVELLQELRQLIEKSGKKT